LIRGVMRLSERRSNAHEEATPDRKWKVSFSWGSKVASANVHVSDASDAPYDRVRSVRNPVNC
jgi:hypothetical protein